MPEISSYIPRQHRRLNLADLGFVAGAVVGTMEGAEVDLRGVVAFRFNAQVDCTAAHFLLGVQTKNADGTWSASNWQFNVVGLTTVNGVIKGLVTSNGVNRTQYWGGVDGGAPNSVILPTSACRVVLQNNGGAINLDYLELELLNL
jgi:hypothetical protein